MKKILLHVVAFFCCTQLSAQISTTQLSSSVNVFTVYGTRTQLCSDPALNTIVFLHRGDMIGTHGNEIYFDVAKGNGGSSWTIDQGPLYTDPNLRGRYPQGVLVNPSGVPDPDSAFVAFMSPLTDTAHWRGIATGQQQLVAGSVASFDIDSINVLHHLIPSGYMVTPQGVIWSVDAAYINDTIYDDHLIIKKGVWNNTSRKYDYTSQVLNAPVSQAGGVKRFLGCNIAFSPDGQSGYVVMNANDGSISDSVYYPIVFKSTDGGQTWNTQTNIGLDVDAVFGLGSPFYTMGPQFDVAVDSLGALHILCQVLEGDNQWNGNSLYNHHGIFDISSITGNQWNAQLIEKPETYLGTFGMIGSTTNPALFEYNRPQISMNATGSKLFFTWIDTDTLIFGTGENLYSDLWVKGYDLATQLLTPATSITEYSGTIVDGSCTFDNVSYYCFTGSGSSTIPVVATVMQGGSISTGSSVDHFYLDNVTIQDNSFTVPASPFVLNGNVTGIHYYIGGSVFMDVNGNGIKDGGEPYMSSQTVSVQPDNLTLFTNSNGSYKFYNFAQGNSHTITTIPPQGWTITSDSASYTVTDDTLNQPGFDFGIGSLLTYNNLEAYIASGIPRCGWDVPYYINYENTGTTVLNGRIIFVIDSATTFSNGAPLPDLISGDSLIYNFTNLYPFSSIQINAMLHMPLQAGDTLFFNVYAQFDSSGNYYTLSENPLMQVVTCSYDPNDKAVNPEGFLADHLTMFNDTLLYTIRFQNTGNDTAFTVVLRDTIDANLDLNTFHVIGSSHDVSASVHADRMVEFRFENILLPDSGTDLAGSNGYVQYRISPNANLTLPAAVNNTAYIYFDFNSPVQTNTVTNTLVNDIYVGIPRAEFPASVSLVPNPFHNETMIVLGEGFSGKQAHLRVMNAWGELVLSKTVNATTEKISRGNLAPGIYFYDVQNADGKRAVGKLVIQ